MWFHHTWMGEARGTTAVCELILWGILEQAKGHGSWPLVYWTLCVNLVRF